MGFFLYIYPQLIIITSNLTNIMDANYQQFLKEIKGFMKESCIYTDELRTLAWGTDASFYRYIPQIVLRSQDEEELSRIVKTAQKYKLPFTFRAAGTSLSGQTVSDSILIVAGKNWEK